MSPSAPRPKTTKEAAPEALTAKTLPDGQEVVTTAPTGSWQALVGEDGENVLVDGKPVQVTLE